MAIIPKGQFQNRISTGVPSASLPDDGSAKPYRELARISDNMAGIAFDMFQRTQSENRENTVQKALTEYAVGNAGTTDQLQNAVDDEGRLGETDYTQAYSDQNDARIDTIADNISDSRARELFKSKVQGQSRSNLVNSISWQANHREVKFESNFKRDNTQFASTLANETDDIAGKAISGYIERVSTLNQREATGVASQVKIGKLRQHTGETYAKAVIDSAILNKDVDTMNKLLNVNLLNSKEAKQFIEENGLEEEAEKMRKAAAANPQVEDTMAPLRGFLSSSDRVSAHSRMLKGLKKSSTLNKEAFNIGTKNITAFINNPNITLDEITTNLPDQYREHIAQAKSLGINPVKQQDVASQIVANFTARMISDKVKMIPIDKGNEVIKTIDEEVRKSLPFKDKLAGGDQIRLVRNKLMTQQKADQFAITEAPAKFVYDNDKGNKQEWDKVSLSNLSGLKSAIADTKYLQNQKGVAAHNFEMMPPQKSEEFAFGINSAMESGDGMTSASAIIVDLKEELGPDTSRFFNEMVKRSQLKDTTLSVVTWLKDPTAMQDAMLTVESYDLNKKDFVKKNSATKGLLNKPAVNLDSMFLKYAGEKMAALQQSTGVRTSIRADAVRKIVEAKFFQLMTLEEEVKESNSRSAMKKAVGATLDRIYTHVSQGDSTAMVPKDFAEDNKLDEPKIRATMKHLKQKGLEAGNIDFDSLGEINRKLVARGNNTQAEKTEAFKKIYGSKFRVLGDDTNFVLNIKTDGGNVPIPFTNSLGQTTFMTRDLEEASTDPLIEALMVNDAESIIDIKGFSLGLEQ